jgi:hypothetical protein
MEQRQLVLLGLLCAVGLNVVLNNRSDQITPEQVRFLRQHQHRALRPLINAAWFLQEAQGAPARSMDDQFAQLSSDGRVHIAYCTS